MSDALYARSARAFPSPGLFPFTRLASAHPCCPTAFCSCWQVWRSGWEPELSPREVGGKDPCVSFPHAWDWALLGARPGGI